MTHLEVVQAVRAKFTTPLYPDHSAAFLVALCRRLRQEFPGDFPAGLRRKDSGTHTMLPNGINVALDIVMYPSGAAYDALGDADGAAVPVWNGIDNLPPDWYVAVSDDTPEPPEPPIPPTPPVPPVPPVDLEPILRRLDAVEAQVAALPPPADPSQWEAWGRFWGFGVTLQLRKKR